MDAVQYGRWKDFALRMARTCFVGRRRPAKPWIVEQVESWFSWRDYQQDWGQYGSWDQDKSPLCDHVAEFYDDLIPRFVCKACEHDGCRHRYPHYEDRCPVCERRCTCDEVWHLGYEQFCDQWLGPIYCCIRAGINVACDMPWGVVACDMPWGVMGFTAGDVRRMYPEGVPEWVFPQSERMKNLSTNEFTVTFAELPNDAQVLL